MLKTRILMSILVLGQSLMSALGCTSGLFGTSVTRDGRPLLWKHRDTSAVDNKVEYIPAADGCYAYVALFNASDRDCTEAWAGFNRVGLAVMNTASYNLKADSVPERDMDKEGIVMTMALQHCATVDDFAALLDSLPKPLGVEANFGVFDASGDGAYFETDNWGYTEHRLGATVEGDAMVRTNYSHSGRRGEGFGYIREANAMHLLEGAIAQRCVSPELLTESVSRSFYHSLHDRDFLKAPLSEWAVDQDFIPRYKTSAVVVIEGVAPDGWDSASEPGAGYVMWTGLGYPPCTEIYPVECREGGVNDALRGIGPDGHAPMSDLAKMRRDEVFPRRHDNGDRYINLSRLWNDEGTGYIQVLVPQNLEAYERYRQSKGR